MSRNLAFRLTVAPASRHTRAVRWGQLWNADGLSVGMLHGVCPRKLLPFLLLWEDWACAVQCAPACQPTRPVGQIRLP